MKFARCGEGKMSVDFGIAGMAIELERTKQELADAYRTIGSLQDRVRNLDQLNDLANRDVMDLQQRLNNCHADLAQARFRKN